MNKAYFALYMMMLFSCSQESKTDSFTENFQVWIGKKAYGFEEYLVMEYESCGSCYSKMTKLIQDGYLDIESDRAIILIVNSKKSLLPIKSDLSKRNLIVYPMDQLRYPIIDRLPRLYQVLSDGLTYNVLNVDQFDKTIRDMDDEIFLTHVQGGHNGFDIEDFKSILVPGHVRISYPMDSGTITSYAIHSGI
jgi:hypothetical protein